MEGSFAGPKPLHKVVIAFGSNLGDRVANVEAAISKMREQSLNIIKLSSLYETKPMYYDDQDSFLNGVCQVETHLDPLALLDLLQSVEKDLGRIRIVDNGPRTIDLDIILYDKECITHPRLNVPHTRLLERDFVLSPLADILPHDVLPPQFTPSISPDKTIINHLHALPQKDLTLSSVTTLRSNMPLIRSRDTSRRTHVMAILNVTPDSFSDGGVHVPQEIQAIKSSVASFIAAGATIIDIGGQSTRPMADFLGPEEELRRILPVVRAIRSMEIAEKVAISIDTFHSDVAREAVLAGADIVNDVSAGLMDDRMLSTVAELGKTIILMHMRGDSHTMTRLTEYPEGVIEGVASELFERIQAASKAGIPPWRIILDPGLGFAKDQEQNLELLHNLESLRTTGTDSRLSLEKYSWLMGPSRKGFIGKITQAEKASERSYGTAAAVTASIAGGADIIRVHDVTEMVQVSKMADAIYRRPQDEQGT